MGWVSFSNLRTSVLHLYDNVFDLHHESRRIIALSSKEAQKSAHRPFIPVVFHVRVIALYVVHAPFVDAARKKLGMAATTTTATGATTTQLGYKIF